MDYAAVDVGQAEVATGVAVGQLFVIHAENVQKGRVQVVHVDRSFHRCVADFVR